MGAWRSIILHRFPACSKYGFYNALPGKLSFNDPGSSIAATRQFKLKEGNWLKYDLDDPFSKVIGCFVDLRLQLFHVYIPHRKTTLVTLGDGQVTLSLVVGHETSSQTMDGHFLLTLAGYTLKLEGLSLPKDLLEFWQVKIRWYTTGQAFLELNGKLAAYQPGFAPEIKLSIPNVALGAPNSSPDTPDLLSVLVTHFHVQLLREQDSKAELARQLDIEQDKPPPIQCGRRAQHLTANGLKASRAFMQTFVEANTTSWRQGQVGIPISAAALKLHETSQAAADSLLRFFRREDKNARETYLKQMRIVFEMLLQTDPAQFKSLVKNADSTSDQLWNICTDTIKMYQQECPDLFDKLETLNKDVIKILHEIGAGDGGS